MVVPGLLEARRTLAAEQLQQLLLLIPLLVAAAAAAAVVVVELGLAGGAVQSTAGTILSPPTSLFCEALQH
jgi:hypothetical protein